MNYVKIQWNMVTQETLYGLLNYHYNLTDPIELHLPPKGVQKILVASYMKHRFVEFLGMKSLIPPLTPLWGVQVRAMEI